MNKSISSLRASPHFCALFTAILTMSFATAHADTPAATVATTVSVSVENGKPQSFDFIALDKLPQHKVHAEAHGNAVDCSGPNLIDVLAQTGVATGEALRGKNLALYVRVSAADGYHAVFALAELDLGIRDNVPILTHQCNGKSLDAKEGPLRIIVPAEKRPARWVRQVTAIDVLRAP